MVPAHAVFKPLPSAHLEERASAAVSGVIQARGSATQMLLSLGTQNALKSCCRSLIPSRQFCDGSRKDAAEED